MTIAPIVHEILVRESIGLCLIALLTLVLLYVSQRGGRYR